MSGTIKIYKYYNVKMKYRNIPGVHLNALTGKAYHRKMHAVGKNLQEKYNR